MKSVLKKPLFLRFIEKESGVVDMLSSFSNSFDKKTSEAAKKLMANPPDLESFRLDLKDAVSIVIKEGLDEDFSAFVNSYMEDSIEEDLEVEKTSQGQNISQTVRVKDEESSWVEGFICYNLCLYIKAFGLESLKQCKVCSKFFNHKGKYAIYCSDGCKKQKRAQETEKTSNI